MQQKDMFQNSGRYSQVQDMNSRTAIDVEGKSPVRRDGSQMILMPSKTLSAAGKDLLSFVDGSQFGTILADPPWQFQNRTGKVAPEHKRLSRYGTMTLDDIKELPVRQIAAPTSHLYLWVPNALLPDGIAVMQAWGFQYKSNIVWHKIRKDGGSDGRGVGFYFRNVTELVLFGVRGKNARTLKPGRTQVNYMSSRKREHSRKPDEQYKLIESCSPGPFLELFARGDRKNWVNWGNQAGDSYAPTWKTYANHSRSESLDLAAASV
jgi:N6-adenosine-specific RNA methylase IME4